jgi:alkylated DNA nucleotide flippase Atl1
LGKAKLPKKRLTWQEKLHDSRGYPRVEEIKGNMSRKWGEGTVVIPAPIEVDQLMRKVPKGKLTTINEIRRALAVKHNATIGCPMTTGIFAWVAAHAAEEQKQQGSTDVTPYWRTLKVRGMINEKYPGGVEMQKRLLQQEGHTVICRGKNYFVADYEKALICL